MTGRPAARPRPITRGMIRALKQFGQARDGMLVLVAGVYILEFLSWAIYSVQENIGFIRIFDAQYFIGGLLPAISIGFIVLGWTLWGILGPAPRLLAAVFVYILFFGILLVQFLTFLPLSPPQQLSWGAAFGIFAAGLVLIPLLLIGSREALQQQPGTLQKPKWLVAVYKEIWGYRVLVAGCGYILTFLTILGMFLLYVGIIYPELPQELGGPRARCADIILDPRPLSDQAWQQFGVKLTTIPDEKSAADKLFSIPWGQPEPTRLLKRAQVIYSDDKVVIFRPDGAPAEIGTIELRKDLVRGLVWCRE